MPAEAGIQDSNKLNKIEHWIPAFAGMTPFPLVATQPPEGEGWWGGKDVMGGFETRPYFRRLLICSAA
jgi:hypothetical protein